MAVAPARTQEASSSISRCIYHVFLSFRGEDTRMKFTSHLYGALAQAGIHTFLDDDGIDRGENIIKELEKAIKESKISIIVFSKDYASSRWCLNELVMIMEMRRVVGLIVLPVFYDVDPSQVRKQTESFGEAFARHEKRLKEEMDKVERWRAALREVADLRGMVLGNRHEWQFIQNIVKEIGNKLNRPILNVAHAALYLVGLDRRIKDINLWIQDGANDVGIAMLYGIGGIGKTTIAKTVYNMNFDRFEGGSFLDRVKESIEKPKGLVCLQKQLLSDILNGKTSKIRNADEGINKVKHAISCKRILLVLDDVDKLDQLNVIIGMREWFSPGTKIIITTRHNRLLRPHEVCKKFKVKQMDDDESLQLFSLHAFGQVRPIEGYVECSKSVMHLCGGLTLALKVLGSSLFDKSINVWKSALQKLEAIPNNEIQEVLEISYFSLKDDHDKNLFLEIACFFIEKDKDYTIAILDSCGFYTTIGIDNLIDRCLLETLKGDDNKERLMMHPLLRDMGREIIRKESTDDPGKRSRLWHHVDAFTVLKEKTGTKTVKGLTFDLRRWLMEDKPGKTIVRVDYEKWHNDENAIFLSNMVDLETETFMKMHKLKLLQLNYVKLRGDYEDFPKNLTWLCWHGFPLEFIPTNFYLEKLVALDMRYSSLKHVWKGTKVLAELKFLNLSHSHGLVRTPDFSGIRSLERLRLKDCISLVEVDASIVKLDRLVLLNLKACKSLRKLPKKIGMLKSLENLILSGCSKLDELPEELGKMKSLKVLCADGVSINQLHVTTTDTKKLNLSLTTSWYSNLWSWLSPAKTPPSISFSLAFLPQSLVRLSLVDCNLSDEDISYGFKRFPFLQVLDLRKNPFRSFPESMNTFTILKKHSLSGCSNLQSFPKLPISLWPPVMSACKLLERDPILPLLGILYFDPFSLCEKLVEYTGLFKLEPIKNTDIAVIESLGLSNLESSGSIEVSIYSILTRVVRKTPLQVLHECGVLCIFLPESAGPGCFDLQSMGSSISFDVPPCADQKICSFNLHTFYASVQHVEYPKSCFTPPYYAKISNKTKRMRWTYSPICFGLAEAEEKEMLWLSHWNFGDQLEGGDQIEVSVVMPLGFEVKKCGIHFVCEAENKVTQSNTEETILSTFPWFQTCTLTQAGATYFRCHHCFATNRFEFVRNPRLYKYLHLFDQNFQLDLHTCIVCEDL